MACTAIYLLILFLKIQRRTVPLGACAPLYINLLRRVQCSGSEKQISDIAVKVYMCYNVRKVGRNRGIL